MQHELTRPSALLDDHGDLLQVGWSRQPLLDCNLEAAHFYRLHFLQPVRLKRWDYYGLTTPELYFSATLTDLGYAEMVFVYVVEFETGALWEETLLLPPGGRVRLPRNSQEGESVLEGGRVRLRFSAQAGERRVQVDWPSFHKGEGIAADFALHLGPEHESVNIVIPIRGRRFYHNRKVNCMPARGWIQRGGRRVALMPETCLGNLDWGRGVWQYTSFWVWASASGFLPGARTLGLNLGFGFGDTSAATEDAILLEGRLHKLGPVKFDYNPGNFMQPWHMRDEQGHLDLTFTPFKERVARTDAVVIRSEVHQMFGRYSGTVTSDSGERIAVRDLIGFAEEHHARW